MTTKIIGQQADRVWASAQQSTQAAQTSTRSAGEAARGSVTLATDVVSDGAHAVVGALDLAIAKARRRSDADVLPGEGELGPRLVTAFDRLSTRGRRVTGRVRRETDSRVDELAAESEEAFAHAHDTGEAAVDRAERRVAETARRASTRTSRAARTVSAIGREPSHRPGVPYEDRTVEELHQLATERNISGRSSMIKDELVAALRD